MDGRSQSPKMQDELEGWKAGTSGSGRFSGSSSNSSLTESKESSRPESSFVLAIFSGIRNKFKCVRKDQTVHNQTTES